MKLIPVPEDLVRALIGDLERIVDAGNDVLVGGMRFGPNGEGPMPVRNPVPIRVLDEHVRSLRDIEARPAFAGGK
jgi:hypothetical protein